MVSNPVSNVHSTAVTNKTKRNWQLTKTNYGIKLINISQKFVKGVQWKYKIGYNSLTVQFLRKFEPSPTHTEFEKAHPTQPCSPTHEWMDPAHDQLWPSQVLTGQVASSTSK